MAGDDLQIALFFIAAGLACGLTAVQVMAWRHRAVLGGLLAFTTVFLVLGLGWTWIKSISSDAAIELAVKISNEPLSYSIIAMVLAGVLMLRRMSSVVVNSTSPFPTGPSPDVVRATGAPVSEEVPPVAKRIYTTKEREDRYEAWSAIHGILDAQCSKALDACSYAANTWKESILSNPKEHSDRLLAAQRLLSESLEQIRAIYLRYGYLKDISGYFESSWGAAQGPMNEAITILRETLKRFPDKPPAIMVDLLDPNAQAVRQSVGAMGQWRTKAKDHAAAQIVALGHA